MTVAVMLLCVNAFAGKRLSHRYRTEIDTFEVRGDSVFARIRVYHNDTLSADRTGFLVRDTSAAIQPWSIPGFREYRCLRTRFVWPGTTNNSKEDGDKVVTEQLHGGQLTVANSGKDDDPVTGSEHSGTGLMIGPCGRFNGKMFIVTGHERCGWMK